MLPIPFDNPTTYEGHSGVDFGQSRGTLIPASGPGIVSALTYGKRPGYVTWVRYDAYPDYEVGYCHQDSPDRPAIGTRVNEGDWLGYVGSTGKNSDGPHLHLETDPGGTYEAVWDLFTADRVVGQGVPSKDPAPIPAPPMAHHLIGEEMFIADMPNGSFLVVPQGNGKPRAVVLDAGSGAGGSGLPRLKFETAGSIGMLTAAVIF